MPTLDRVEKQRETRSGNRRVGPIPKPSRAWATKRRRCAGSLGDFCLTFLPAKFFLPFSGDHLKVIAKLERVARDGGTFALAMPRGSGKTELCKATALWSILYGYRSFVVLVGATAKLAGRMLEDVKSSLAHNDELYAAFPEATHCVRDMKGIVHRARVQSFDDGEPTGLEWTQDGIQLARVKDAKCAGAVIRTAGLTGAVRGLSATGKDGGTIRPDLVLLDDPQDRESATSPQQTADRERIVRGDILGLAGKTKSIAAVMPCTVIAENDLADRFLDRQKNPQWNGERTRRVVSFPGDEVLWERYFELRADELRASGTSLGARAFYRDNRAAMDAGCVLSWPEAFDAERFGSAVEEMMCRRRDDPEAFAAEDQNAPLPVDLGALDELTEDEVAEKLNGCPRRLVPPEVTRMTAFIDVGNKVLFWAVCGWAEGFSGHVIDYGTFPKQNKADFAANKAQPALSDLFPDYNEDVQIFQGLKAVAAEILDCGYRRQDGTDEVRVERCFVDSGAKWTATVAQFVRQSPYKDILTASKGWGIGSGRLPMAGWVLKPGERRGDHWVMRPNTEGGHGRLVTFDANHWKNFVAKALKTPPAGAGCLQLFGDKPGVHRLFAQHMTAEYRSGKHGTTGEVGWQDLWALRPGRPDNHWWDTIVGAAAAASFAGVSFSVARAAGETPYAKPARKKIKLSELYARKNGVR